MNTITAVLLTCSFLKSLDPAEVALDIDGKTDPCSNNRDINFIFKGVTVTGKVRLPIV